LRPPLAPRQEPRGSKGKGTKSKGTKSKGTKSKGTKSKGTKRSLLRNHFVILFWNYFVTRLLTGPDWFTRVSVSVVN
jgi:hypothetical protein